jgi:uncharacterized protein YceK
MLPLIILALLLCGCGSTRQETIHTEEKYTETTTTPDGQMTTKQGQRVVNTQAQSETKLDLKPAIDPSWISMIGSFFLGPQFSTLLNVVLGGYAMHQRAKAGGMQRMLDYTQDDLNEQWQMNKARMNHG